MTDKTAWVYLYHHEPMGLHIASTRTFPTMDDARTALFEQIGTKDAPPMAVYWTTHSIHHWTGSFREDNDWHLELFQVELP